MTETTGFRLSVNKTLPRNQPAEAMPAPLAFPLPRSWTGKFQAPIHQHRINNTLAYELRKHHKFMSCCYLVGEKRLLLDLGYADRAAGAPQSLLCWKNPK